MYRVKVNITSVILSVFILSIFITILLNSSGCQTIKKSSIVKTGDDVLVDFTCRLENNEMVMTSVSDIENSDAQKASIFLPLKKYGPFPITAGSGKKGPDYGKLKTLEREILESLSLEIVGAEYNSLSSYKLSAEDAVGLTDEERYLTRSYVSKHDKIRKINAKAYKNRYGKELISGDIIALEQLEGASFEVLSVEGDMAEVRLNLEDGMVLDKPIGKAIVRDSGDHYTHVLDIHEGDIVRSNVIVGRIIDIGEEMFTLDYANPFGGETLACDVVVKKELEGNLSKQEN